MCGRFTMAKDQAALSDRFEAQTLFPIAERYNIAPTQAVPIVRAGESGRTVEGFTWGLVPFWAKDKSIGSKMINARRETLAEKPAFKYALSKRRCLIPADGFYEWQKQEDGTKQPFRFRRTDDALFAFAGLYESWKPEDAPDDAPPLHTFTIITTQANGVVGAIHDRMPAMLLPDDESLWLNPAAKTDALLNVLMPYPDVLMEAFPVSRRVNLPANDDAALIVPK